MDVHVYVWMQWFLILREKELNLCTPEKKDYICMCVVVGVCLHTCTCGVYIHCSNYMTIIGGAWSNAPPIDIMYM